MTDLLPPNATALERSLARVAAHVSEVPLDLAALWNPGTCPIHLLPWLAWALSTDRWDRDWSDDQKRAAVASAIDDQRHKGSRAAVETVLQRFDDLLELVEWFEASPRLAPFTFEIRLPLIDADGAAGGARVTAAFAREIVREVSKAKPTRAHFQLIQTLELHGLILPVVAAQATGYVRLTGNLRPDLGGGTPMSAWQQLLQDENGEPLTDDTNETIDGSAV